VKGGSKYVLIVGEKVYAISNQQHAGLAQHAGERVVVTGTFSGHAIEVSEVETSR
jgi:hypothetical protein